MLLFWLRFPCKSIRYTLNDIYCHLFGKTQISKLLSSELYQKSRAPSNNAFTRILRGITRIPRPPGLALGERVTLARLTPRVTECSVRSPGRR